MKKNIDEKTTTTNTPDTPNEEKETLGVENDVRVIIKSKTDGVLFDQDCCTTINIILNNDAQIATSFLGIHNESIIKSMERAIKIYFKALKKTLKEERKRAKEIIDTDQENSNKQTTEEIAKNEDPIHHIKDFTPINPNDSNLDESVIKDKESKSNCNTTTKECKNTNTKTKQTINKDIKSDKKNNNQKSTKVVKTATPSYEHICDENGCRLVRKKLDPKSSPDDTIAPQTNSNTINHKKSSKNIK